MVNLKPGEYLSIIMSLASISLLWLITGRAFGLVPKSSEVRLLLGAPGVNLIIKTFASVIYKCRYCSQTVKQ